MAKGLFEAVKELLEEWTCHDSPATADIFDDQANHGRFDEEGGELSDQDWADSQ